MSFLVQQIRHAPQVIQIHKDSWRVRPPWNLPLLHILGCQPSSTLVNLGISGGNSVVWHGSFSVHPIPFSPGSMLQTLSRKFW